MLRDHRHSDHKSQIQTLLSRLVPTHGGLAVLLMKNWSSDVFYPVAWKSSADHESLPYYLMPVAASKLKNAWSRVGEINVDSTKFSFHECLAFGRCDLFNGMCSQSREVWGMAFGCDTGLALLISGNTHQTENRKFYSKPTDDSGFVDRLAAIEYAAANWYYRGHEKRLAELAGFIESRLGSDEREVLTDLFSDADSDPPFWPFRAYEVVANPNENTRMQAAKLNLLGWHCEFASIEDHRAKAPWLGDMPGLFRAGAAIHEVDLQQRSDIDDFMKKASTSTVDIVIKAGCVEAGNEKWDIFLRFNVDRKLTVGNKTSLKNKAGNVRLVNTTVHSLYQLLQHVAEDRLINSHTVITMVWAISSDENNIEFIGAIPGDRVDMIAAPLVQETAFAAIDIEKTHVHLHAKLLTDVQRDSALDKLVGEYVSAIDKQLGSVKPEQAITAFFDWRRTNTTTKKLHAFDNVTLDDFRNSDPFRAVSSMLRMSPNRLAEIVHCNEIRTSVVESLKGMGGEDDSVIGQQCSIVGVFLVAWSAYRVKLDDDEKFSKALRTFAISADTEDRSDIERYCLVTQGKYSAKEVLSAFYVCLELATDKKSRSIDQVASVRLGMSGFSISFKLGERSVSRFKSAIDRILGAVQADLERERGSNSSVDLAIRDAGANQTTRALLHHMLVARRRQYRDGCEQWADFAVDFGHDEITLRWFPKPWKNLSS